MSSPESDVPIERSRAKIEKLLRAWGCRQIGWLEDTTDEVSVYEVQFSLLGEGGEKLAARFHIELQREDGLTVRQQERRDRGRFRTLFLWLEGALRAVEAGIVPPEAIFLAWLSGPDGTTVWEAVRPHLKKLSTGSARGLLGPGLDS